VWLQPDWYWRSPRARSVVVLVLRVALAAAWALAAGSWQHRAALGGTRVHTWATLRPWLQYLWLGAQGSLLLVSDVAPCSSSL
jgi:hypothetical protein